MAQTQGQSRCDREYRGALRKIKLITGLILGLLLLLVLTLRFVIGFGFVRGDGMSPTYTRGRPLVFLRLAAAYKRNDIVLVALPDGTTAPLRVLGAAGDLVELRDGLVTVNGIAERGSYSFGRTDPVAGGPDYPLLLRAGEYFVLGDARADAVDSRSFGLITADSIRGRVLN